MEKLSEKEQVLQCPDCGSANLVTDHEAGEIICGDCGLVVTDQVFSDKPRRIYLDDSTTHGRIHHGTGVHHSLHDKGLTTSINVEPDAFGRSLKGDKKFEIRRLSKLQNRNRVQNSRERSMAAGLSKLDLFCDNLGLPQPFKDRAAVIYRKALDKGFVRGRSIAAVVAAAIYISCREKGLPRSLTDMANKTEVKKKDLGRVYRLIVRELNYGAAPPKVSALAYLGVIVKRTGASGEAEGIAARILHELSKKKLSAGKGPKGLAGAALYIAGLQCGDNKVTQKRIVQAVDITEVTIRNRYKEICRELGLPTTKGELQND